MDKQQLRIWAKEERKKLDIKALSDELVKNLQDTEEYKQAKNIMLFYPKKDEINLLSLLKDKSKNFYLPKIDGESLLCCPYNQDEELCESCFKTKEPITTPVEKDLIDLVIVPALAVDRNNYRLGYGGGFYDRFLVGVNVVKVVCLPKEFVLDSVYPAKHDIQVDKIIFA
jgi:5-formyltetrahydrofolate cyclo-ligase